MVKIFSWNILSDEDVLSSFPHNDANTLIWENRFPQIIQIIKQANADLVALQEVDVCHFTEITDEFKEYQSIYVVKTGDRKNGCLTLYKNLTVQNNIIVKNFTNCHQVFILVEFTDFIHVNVHLKAKSNMEATRLQQITELTEILKINNQNKPICISGDFNSIYSEVGMRNLLSEYSTVFDYLHCYTSLKKRDAVYKYCIDYILYKGLVCVSKELVQDNQLLPNYKWPSDHLCLIATLDKITD